MSGYINNWYFWFTFFALIFSFSALIVSIDTWKRLRYFIVLQNSTRHSRQLLPSETGGKVYVIYNPSKKFNLTSLKEKISSVAANAGMDEPIWLKTEKDDTGYTMALKAVEDKASVVITAGGDGTVRAVAAGLCGTNIPMGILPVGTTNLLARNLGLPINDLNEAVSVALTGRNRQIDVGWMHIIDGEYSDDFISNVKQTEKILEEVRDSNNQTDRFVTQENKIDVNKFAFLIMAGIGFDGDMMANVPNEMKRKIGWFAYVLSALKNLTRERMNVSLRIGVKEKDMNFKARSVLFANCGQLPRNIVLLPEAHIDDGWLDVAIIDVRSKIFGWISLYIKVILQGIGIKSKIPEIIGKLDILRTHKAHLVTDKYYNLQIDGEYMGRAKKVDVYVQSDALAVRTA